MDYEAFQDLKFYFSDLTSSYSSPAHTTSTTPGLLLIQNTNFLALLSLCLWVNTKMLLSRWPLNNVGSGHFTLGEQSVKSPECSVSVIFPWTCTDRHTQQRPSFSWTFSLLYTHWCYICLYTCLVSVSPVSWVL